MYLWQNIKLPRWLSHPLQPDLVPCNFWLFPKLNTTGQLMVIGRTVWGPNVPTLKGTEASLSYVQCFLYLVSSSINASSFHITWLDTLWTDLIYIKYPDRLKLCFIKAVPGWIWMLVKHQRQCVTEVSRFQESEIKTKLQQDCVHARHFLR